MATIYNYKRKTYSFRREDDTGWLPTLLFVGSIGIIILFLWTLQDKTLPPTGMTGVSVSSIP